MSDLSAGRAYVEVVPSLKDFHKKNAAEMRKAGAQARKAFDDGFSSGKAPSVPTPDPKQSREKGRQSGEQFAGAFDREVRTKVTAALKSLPDAQIGADASEAEREVAKVRASLERLSKQRIGVDIDEATALNRLESLQRRLQELGASDDATIGVKANTTQAALQLDKIRVSAEAVGALSPTVTVDADTAAAEAKIAAVSSVSASAGASGLVTSALLLGPALIPGAAAATAGVAGLGAAGAAGGAGLGVAAFALSGVSDAVTALGEAQKTQGKTAEQVAAANEKAAAAMAGLSPEGRKFAEFINGLRGTISDLQADAAKGFLPGLQKGMKSAGEALSPFRGIVGSLAKEMGGLMASAGKGLGGEAFQRFFAMVEKTGGPTLRLLGGIIGDIAKAFAGLAVAFQPVATQVLTGLKKLTDRFAAFANEGEGGGLSKFVDYVRENGPKVAAMIGSLARAFGRVIRAVAPFGEKVVAVIKSVSDRIAGLPIGTLRKLIGTVVGLTLAWKAATLAAAAIASVQRVWAAALAATTFVTKAAAVAQRLLNAAMRMNPIGLIVTALIALGAVMVLAYKKSETFRRIVDAAWAGIKRAAMATVAWFKDVAWPWMRDAFQWIGDKAMWLWRNGIKPAFGFIWGIAKTVFGWLKNVGWPMVNGVFAAIAGGALWLWGKVRSVFNFLKRGFETVAAVATWLGKVVLGVVIVAIWALFKWLWSKVKPVFAAIRSGLSAVGRAGRWLYEKALRPAFNAIAAAAKWLWNRALKPALNWIKGGFTLLKDKAKWLWTWVKRYFQAVADNAKWLWGKVQWALNKIKSGFGLLKDKVKWLRDWIKRYFQAIKANADWLWDKVKPSFNKLKDGVSAVKKAFGDAKDGIGRAWGKIYGKITGPIKKALRWLNKNLIGKLNSLLRDVPGVKFRIEPIDTSGFDTGGYTGPGHYKKPAGLVHAGEMVIKKDSTNKLRKSIGMSGLNYMNRTGELPAGGYAGGGIVALGKRLQGMGYDVSEHPAFGGVVPGAHSASGYHYKGGALDINADPWNSRFNRETSALDSLNRMLRGEGWNTIWRAPNHWDHLHVDVANGQGGSGGGLGFLTKFLPDWAKSLVDSPMGYIKDKISGLMGKMPGGFGLAGKVLPGIAGKMASGIGQKVRDTFSLSGLLDKFVPDFLSGGDKGGGGTDRWRGTVMRALGMLGLPSSLAGTTLRRMNQESGGDPRALNNWDSNAARGTPSKGLMQVIGCVPLSTRILTQRGWLSHEDVREGDVTIGFNHDTGRSEWTRISGVVHYDDADVWRIGNGHWSADVTPEHRWVTETDHDLVDANLLCPTCGSQWATRRGMETHLGKAHKVKQDRVRVTRSGFTRTSELKRESLRVAAPAETPTLLPITDDEAAILAWIDGDGCMRPALDIYGEQSGWDADLYQSKPAGVERIRALMAGAPHTETQRKPRPSDSWPSIVWRLRRSYVTELVERSGVRRMPLEDWVMMLSTSQRAAWLQAMIDAEGHTADGFTRITQVNGPVQDAIRLAVYLAGYRPTFSRLGAEGRGFKPSGNVGMARSRVAVSMMSEPEMLERQPVWCVETDLGSWTMRQGDRITLTGNSTFRAHAYPGRNDIWNPLDNVLASMRYALARYGSLSSAYNRAGGYSGGGLVKPAVFDNGGTLAPGLNFVHNKLGKPEPLVRPEHAMAGGATFVLKDSDGVLLGVIRGEIQDNDAFKASVGRMGHG